MSKTSKWEETKKKWGETSYKERKFAIKRMILRRETTFEKVNGAGGASALAQKSFNLLPVFICDLLVRHL